MTYGPWIPHIQGPMPVSEGTIVQCIMNGDPTNIIGPILCELIDWNMPGDGVTKYRIQEPKGLEMLREIARNVKSEDLVPQV